MQRCHAAIIIGENQFINFHGEDCVRLISEQTVHGWVYTPSLLMVVVAPLLFLDPVTQVQELHRVFVDEIASTARWNALSSKLKGQLQDSNLLATVLLNVNVGFLAINSVDRGGKSAVQMANYMSLVTSLGSIILGIFLVWHEQTSGDNTALEAALFALKLHDQKHGLEKLAIIYSVPKALLMWGMVFFFVAFSIDWCSAGDTTSRVVVGTVILIVFVMISNGIIRIREGERWWWRTIGHQLSSLPARAWKRVMEFVEMKRGQRCEPQPDPEEASLHSGLSQANVEVDASMRRTSDSTTSRNFLPEIPGAGGHKDHSNSPIPLTDHVTTSSCSAAEGMVETAVNAKILHPRALPMTATILSKNEGQTAAVANDMGAIIWPNTQITSVEEPEELDYPRPSPSAIPPPMIVGRSATDEPFRHAPIGAK
ncbi:hypothetical protein EDB19DRAFT_1820418 [Suillus lakei]|nr:hypothetical protein EDB19DRAFT_1820418 [Suillus lakei]